MFFNPKQAEEQSTLEEYQNTRKLKCFESNQTKDFNWTTNTNDRQIDFKVVLI